MPNGILSEQEYDVFERWYTRTHPWTFPRGMPKNVEGIRENTIYKQWLREEPIARPTARAVELAATLGPLPSKMVAAPETPSEAVARVRRAEGEAAGVDLGGKAEIEPMPTEPPPAGFRWGYDRDLNRWVPQFTGQEELQRQQLELQRQQQAGFPAPTMAAQQRFPAPMAGLAAQQVQPEPRQVEPPTDAFGRTATWNARLGEWDYPPNWGQRPVDEPAPISPFQREQFGLQEQQQRAQQQQFQQQQQQTQAQFQQQLEFQQTQLQAAQQEQERQYMSQLAAQPINWLQYAAYTGQPPVVQPWMQPLGFQETEGALPQGVEVGQPIPGFQGQAGQQGMQTFAGLPQLTTPSAQLQARWGPTAQAQFLGYRQARTGALPEETQFRLGSGRAPTGAFGGFSRFR